MKILIIMRYVKQHLAFAVSFIKTAKMRGVALASVRNIFKKKSCGASPLNGETFISIVNNDMDRKMIAWGWMKKA